ncbi:hypothetical protein PTKIN_Ptkin13bG0155600 [Pterospermum kingtungense]
MASKKFVDSPVTSRSSSVSQSRSINRQRRSVYCDCGLKAPIRTATTTNNVGKKFFGCSKYNNKGEGCGFFLWIDGHESDDILEVDDGDDNEEMVAELKLLAESRELRIENNLIKSERKNKEFMKLMEEVRSLKIKK